MSLNIKNERVHALAREAARRMGRSQTSVIEEALARLLAELDEREAGGGPDRTRRVGAILEDIDARLTDADRAALGADDLYDESGMPA
ncbi:type II toxin-antitoxin system VapB family antitoxin [Skermania sp. ID1734]|uniref:type II toxin-antitoxin system VapB family antitoxin n=1 Tax=Skermania sp. ID1734 TaxID=2597516 RepID=UPI00163DB303|nr:type II toxin-antitoxin system VapB family antitoxin [Skermania sp. ID1734]